MFKNIVLHNLKEKQKPINVVFVGESGFPRGLATIQRLTLMAKALLFAGAKTTVLCRKGVHNERENIDFGKSGVFEGIDYAYTSPGLFKPKSFIKRNFDKLLGIWGEFAALSKLKSESKVDALIVSEMKVIHVLRYWLFSKVIGIVMIANLVEMASSMQHRKGLLKRWNDFILDKWVIRLYDGAMPISDILCEYYGEVATHKPFVKVPIVCDFDKFKKNKTPHNPYFLYCGSFRYKEVRDFVIESYKRIANNEVVKLYMIVSGGSKKETLALEAEVNTMFKTDPVRLFSNIPYSELVDLYVNANALLIPLRPTIQDSARFPHKIGEYLASGNPVITTNIGEIKNYFQDQVNALVADKYKVGMFAEKMQFVIDNPIKAIKIGHQGQQMGWQNFDYRTQGKLMLRFIENLVNKNDKTST